MSMRASKAKQPWVGSSGGGGTSFVPADAGKVVFVGPTGSLAVDTGFTYNSGTDVVTVSGGMNISALTPGSVLFAGASGSISQNNSKFSFTNTLPHSLYLGTTVKNFSSDIVTISTQGGVSNSGGMSITGNGNGAATYLIIGRNTGINDFFFLVVGTAGANFSNSQIGDVIAYHQTAGFRFTTNGTASALQLEGRKAAFGSNVGRVSPVNTVDSLGSFGANIIRVASNYAVGEDDYTVVVNAFTGPVTITLPVVANSRRRIYNIKKIDPSLNAVTISTAGGSDVIDGAGTTIALSLQNEVKTLQSEGANNCWWILN